MNNKTFSRFIFFTIAVMGIACLHGQTPIMTVYSDLNNCDTSIIRHWKESTSIVYAKTPTGNFFLMDNPSTPSSLKCQTKLDVKDMEIVEDTLYYCGTAAGASYIGFFCINDFFTSSVAEKKVLMPPYTNGSEIFRFQPRRLEVFHVSGGYHVVMVSDMVCPSDTIKRVMMDARSFYGATYWAVTFWAPENLFDDRSNIFYPDDVAVTDNYVIYVGHKHQSAGIYMRKYLKINNVTYNIHYYTDAIIGPPVSNYFYNAYTFNVLGHPYGEYPVWCKHTLGDTIAIAYMSEYKYGQFGAIVKKIDVQNILNNTINLILPFSSVLNPDWAVRDIRFDKAFNTILMLYDADNPISSSLQSMIMTIDHTFLNNPETHYTLQNNIIHHSLDKFNYINNNFSTCGKMVGTNLSIGTHYLHLPGFESCTGLFIPYFHEIKDKLSYFEIETDPRDFQASQTPEDTPVTTTPLDIFCE